MTDTNNISAKDRQFVVIACALAVLAIVGHHRCQQAAAQQAMPAAQSAYGMGMAYNAYAQQAYMAAAGRPAAPPSYTAHGMPYVAPVQYVEQPLATEYVDEGYVDEGYVDEGYGAAPVTDGLGPHGALSRLFTAQRYDDHWVDIRADYVYFFRDGAAANTVFTTDGVMGTPVLSMSDVDVAGENASGVRVSGAFDFWYACDVEVSWMGGLHWAGAAEATSTTNSLFSILSDFGDDPDQGYLETDQAARHAVAYSSDLENVEINARWRWCHSSAPVSGAWILGARYLQLAEKFRLLTHADAHIDPVLGGPRGPGDMDYQLSVVNDLVGFQIGGEIMTAPCKDLMIGADLEAGIYGNTSTSSSRITATTLTSPLIEKQEAVQTAFVCEASAMALYRVYHDLYVRGGYQMLFVQGVGTGPNNFNSTAPLVGRTLSQSTSANLLLHGFYGGFEWQY